MASELRVTTIANNAGTESIDTTYVVNGSAKAWFKYDHINTTIDDSLNLSSVTDTTTGEYEVFWTSSFNNAHYAMALIGDSNTSHSHPACYVENGSDSSQTTSQCGFEGRGGTNGSKYDQINFGSIHGDLA